MYYISKLVLKSNTNSLYIKFEYPQILDPFLRIFRCAYTWELVI